MSLTLTLIIVFAIEIAVVGVIFSVLYAKKTDTPAAKSKDFDKNAELVEIYRKRLADYEAKMESNLVDLHNIGEKLAELMAPIKETAFRLRKKEAALIDKRIQFVQSEVDAIINKEYGDEYWDNLCIRLSELMPSPVINTDNNLDNSVEPDAQSDNELQDDDNLVSETTAELDIESADALPAVESDAGNDDDIPILSHKIRIDKNSPTIAYITLTPLQNEIKRLKRIVGRHFGMLSDMKQAIIENKHDVEHFTKLPKALKELQIVHVQLTRSVKALKEENVRLTKILTTNNSIAGDSDNLMDDSKRKALASLKQNQAPLRPARKRSAKNG
jgi:hypothetical protein